MGTLNKIKPQHGFALFMTLVTLVIITLSIIAMMRVMEAGVSAAGNIAFRQAAIGAAGAAAAAVNNRLARETNPILAVTGSIGTDYYANVAAAFDPLTHNWADNIPPVGPISGYTVNYVIHRLAMGDGLCETAQTGCTFSSEASSVGTEVGASYSGGTGTYGKPLSPTGFVYYSVTAKVSGPKHNINYVQTLMY